MLSIGALSRRTGVKIPTIRYYEDIGLLDPPGRSAGNQRRYDAAAAERLGFIRHARALGFPLEAISSLIELSGHPDEPCARATEIARDRLNDVRQKIARLTRLERELARIAEGCDGQGTSGSCYVLASLSDHAMCGTAH